MELDGEAKSTILKLSFEEGFSPPIVSAGSKLLEIFICNLEKRFKLKMLCFSNKIQN